VSDPRRVLLDECVPATLRRHLPDFEVKTVRQLGWDSKLDGELLREADQKFDVFVTVDRNLVYQQNLSGISLGIVVLVAFSNDIRELHHCPGVEFRSPHRGCR
jgi:predicted nuclease of predicted toxin-antitoxin system